MTERRLTDWVDSFTAFVEAQDIPKQIGRWCAISTVASALERKIWIENKKGILYPNLFILIVAAPGIGKTLPISKARSMINAIRDINGKKTHFLTANSITGAALINELHEATRTFTSATLTMPSSEFNALAAFSNELSVFMPTYDPEFAGKLIELWDCEYFRERRRGKDLNLEIAKPCLNLLAATQPSFLGENFPDAAWDQGFMARVITIYQDEFIETDLFDMPEEDRQLEKNLRHDINIIAQLQGHYTFEPQAVKAIKKWISAGKPPVPEHPRLTNYNVRRTPNMLKLCMIACASRTNENIIELRDFETALEWLIEAESYLPDLFHKLGGKGDSKILEDAFHFLIRQYARTKQPPKEEALIAFFQQRVPIWQVPKMIEGLESAGYAKPKQVKGLGKCYVPQLGRMKE